MMCRRLIAGLLFLPVAAALLWAKPVLADDDAARLQAAQKLLAETNMESVMNQSMDKLMDVYSKNPQMAPYKDTMKAFFGKYMSWDAMKDDYAKLYADNFTEQELNDLIAFYGTPTGKKASQVLPTLMAQGAEIGSRKVQEHMGELQTMLTEAAKKQGQ